MTTVGPAASLIPTRALNSKIGTQTYVPPRFLGGLLPTSLVDEYVFWQFDDDNIIGYEKVRERDEDDDDPLTKAVGDDSPSSRLKITLLKSQDFDKTGFCNSFAEAFVLLLVQTTRLSRSIRTGLCIPF
jgi:hypothetical protein